MRFKKYGNRLGAVYNFEGLDFHQTSNDAADNFLNLLCR